MGTKISSLHSVDPYFLESLQGDVFDTPVNYPNPNCKYDNMKHLSTSGFQMVPELVLSDKRRDITLKLRIYYPTIISSKSPIPIIIFSPIAFSTAEDYQHVLKQLACCGYLCIYPLHHDSNLSRLENTIKGIGNAWANQMKKHFKTSHSWQRRAQEISFIMSSIGMIESKVPELNGCIDSQRISVAGHSLGSYAALLLAGATIRVTDKEEGDITLRLRDHRVKVFILHYLIFSQLYYYLLQVKDFLD